MDEIIKELMRRYGEMEQRERTCVFVSGNKIIWPAEIDDYFSREEIALLEAAFQQPAAPAPLEP